jgi:hypothetical protein
MKKGTSVPFFFASVFCLPRFGGAVQNAVTNPAAARLRLARAVRRA